MKVLDLFSGVGGFAIAAHWAGFQTTQFVEIEPFCQQILSKLFQGVPIHGDITTFTAARGAYDIVTFGSPCQDFSYANANGRGLEGKRSGLFYEAIRIVREVRPKYCVFENVPGLFKRGFEQVLWEFSESGYDAEWQTISAASLGAPHLRKRVFIVAYPYSQRCRQGGNPEREHQDLLHEKRDSSQDIQSRDERKCGVEPIYQASPHPEGIGRGSFRYKNLQKGAAVAPISSNAQADTNTRGTTKRQLCRVDDGLPRELDSPTYWQRHPMPEPLTEKETDPYRKQRIKALGNAVTPQQALIPLLRIKELEESFNNRY